MPKADSAGQQTNGEAVDADSRFETLTEAFLSTHYATHPVQATATGQHDYDHCLENFNRFALRDHRDCVRAYLHAIDKISLADLNSENRLDYRLARSTAQKTLFALDQRRWPELDPVAYVETVWRGLLLLLPFPLIDAQNRASSLLGRLRAVPDAFLEARQNLKSPPRIAVEAAITMAQKADSFFTDLLPRSLAALPQAGLRRVLTEAAEKARTAFTDYAGFLHEAVLPRATEDFALGQERYDYLLRIGHLLEKERASGDAILAIGQAALDDAQRELSALPVQETPVQDGNMPVVLRPFGSRLSEEVEETAGKMKSSHSVLSRFRTHFATSELFINGWALYHDGLRREQGPPTEILDYRSHLQTLRFHACCALLDVRLHTGQMSVSEAACFLQQEAQLEEAAAWAESLRSALNPTLSMTPLIGRHALLALREEKQRRQGSQFDIHQFHTQALSYGAVPPALLRDALLTL